MSKYFLVSSEINALSEQDVILIEKENERINKERQEFVDKTREEVIVTPDDLIHAFGRVVIKIDLEKKNELQLTEGIKISLQRQFNNLNRRYTEPVNAIVISAEDIPQDAEILIHPNAIIDSNKIFDYKANSVSISYYSIPREQCFIWRKENEWVALPPYQTALRIYEPYTGAIEGIKPKLLKDALWVTSGEFKNKAVITIHASAYEVIFQDINGREGRKIRFRPSGDPIKELEPEAIAISGSITKKILSGEYLIGLSEDDCKKYEK